MSSGNDDTRNFVQGYRSEQDEKMKPQASSEKRFELKNTI